MRAPAPQSFLRAVFGTLGLFLPVSDSPLDYPQLSPLSHSPSLGQLHVHVHRDHICFGVCASRLYLPSLAQDGVCANASSC